MQVTVDAKPETVPELLRKVDPMLRYQLSLSNKVKLIETLKEITMQAYLSHHVVGSQVRILI